jgi:UDP-N-acetyl-D-galactosamine dehydrogenase
VDPYYLTYKAQELGYHPEIILAGRRINDSMGEHVADRLVKLMTTQGINVVGSRVLILGLAFKENCPDVRNTKVIDVVNALKNYNVEVDIHDPWADAAEVSATLGLTMTPQPQAGVYDAAVLAVAHHQFVSLGSQGICQYLKDQHVLFDVKHVLARQDVTARL